MGRTSDKFNQYHIETYFRSLRQPIRNAANTGQSEIEVIYANKDVNSYDFLNSVLCIMLIKQVHHKEPRTGARFF